MTFDEFKQMALNPPRRDEPTIFEVTEYDITSGFDTDPSSECESECEPDTTPECEPDSLSEGQTDSTPDRKCGVTGELLYNISKWRVGFGPTLEEAETLMREAIDKAEENDTRIYCFHIREYPLGVCLNDYFHNLGVSARLYDELGNLLDHTFCSDLDRDYDTEFGRFRGRSPRDRRFREGELVEFLTDDEVQLVEVGSSGPTIEWCWRLREGIKTEPRFQKKEGSPLTDAEIDRCYPIDASDDQIIVYHYPEPDDEGICVSPENGPDHSHVNPLFLRHPLPRLK